MRLFGIIIISLLHMSCKNSGRFNWYNLLTEKPAVTELIGTYSLKTSDPAASTLIDMGYTEINCSTNLKADGTFTASRLPGCFLHGWDEEVYTFTGGIYSISGDWAIIKDTTVYKIKLSITSISEHTSLVISDPVLANQRKPPTSLDISLLKGSPLDLGFNVFDGDFVPIHLSRINPEKPTKLQNKSQ